MRKNLEVLVLFLSSFDDKLNGPCVGKGSNTHTVLGHFVYYVIYDRQIMLP